MLVALFYFTTEEELRMQISAKIRVVQNGNNGDRGVYSRAVVIVGSLLSSRNTPVVHYCSTSRSNTFIIRKNVIRIFHTQIKTGKFSISFRCPAEHLFVSTTPKKAEQFVKIVSHIFSEKPPLSLIAYDPVKLNKIARKPAPESILSKEALVLTDFDRRILQSRNLSVLVINKTKLKTLPNELGELSLQQLDLANNSLISVDFLKRVPIRNSLRSLILSRNEITEFPSILLTFPKLGLLNFAENTVTSIPGIFGYSSLVELDLHGNILQLVPYGLSIIKLQVMNFFDIANDTKIIVDAVNGPFPKLREFAAKNVPIEQIKNLSSDRCPIDVIQYLTNLSVCKCRSPSIPRSELMHPITMNFHRVDRIIRGVNQRETHMVYHTCGFFDGCLLERDRRP